MSCGTTDRNQQVGGSSPLAGTIKTMGYDRWRVLKEFGVTYGVTFSWSLDSTLASSIERRWRYILSPSRPRRCDALAALSLSLLPDSTGARFAQ